MSGPRWLRLTLREHEVLMLYAAGMAAREIAEHLSLSRSAVDQHLETIRLKAGARRRSEVIVLAVSSGLLEGAAVAPNTQVAPSATRH